MSEVKDLEYARAYIVLQKYKNIYPFEEGFSKGTAFEELYRPYKRKSRKDAIIL